MFYIAHRLFAAHDRALAAEVAHTLARIVGADSVFLPFADTGQEDLTAEAKGERLFELDVEQLERSTGMVALLHGPSVDDGVCVEIGYATAAGIPVVVLTTDFQTYGRTADSPGTWLFPDPLLECLPTDRVSVQHLGPATAPASADRFEEFASRNASQVAEAAGIACARIAELALPSPVAVTPKKSLDAPTTVFVEPSPWRGPGDTAALEAELRRLGLEVTTARRFHDTDPIAAATADWEAALAADLLVADVSGPEAPPGASALIGAAVATGRRALAWQPAGAWTFAAGREPNWCNLMIQYAVSGRFTDVSELAGLIAG